MAVIQEYEESKLWGTGEQLTYIINSYNLFDFIKKARMSGCHWFLFLDTKPLLKFYHM